MGDVSTHATIHGFVMAQLRAAVPATLVPEDHYTDLELGNYLTDLSQFRDPPAHHAGRVMTHTTALRTFVTWNGILDDEWFWATLPLWAATGLPLTLFAYGAGLTGWTHRLFGQGDPTSERHGALAEFFRRISLGVAHQSFTAEGHAAIAVGQARLARLPEPLRPSEETLTATPSLPPVSASRLDAVHDAHFTQYWPHEHLDFPAVEDAEHHRDLPRFQTSPRKVQAYLEEHIEALAQQFATLELDWTMAVDAGVAAESRRDLVVRLGHLLHAIEDWWFHSNFVELYRWNQVRQEQPALDPTTDADLDTLLAAALEKGGAPDTTRQRRLLHRRLRYPVYDGDELSDLDDDTSLDGTAFVFTGAFGATDIFHTLGKALESMEHGPQATATLVLAHSGLALFEVLLSQAARRAMVRDEDESKKAGEHEEQLKNGAIHALLDTLHADGELCERAWQELRRAFDLDLEVEKEWFWFPGCGGMLIQLMGLMQEERQDSAARQAELDTDATSPRGIASSNEASGENVGTHSLLAKDTPTSDPFRKDAVRLAQHASASVARHLLTRVASGAPPTQGIDWVPLLRFYLRYPEAGAGTWWSDLLGDPTPGDAPQPDVTAVTPQPSVTMLGPTNDQAKLAALRAGGKLDELQTYYRSFED